MASVQEVIAGCPRCKAFQTLWFKEDVLVPTRKFAQREDCRVYHDCGTRSPCRLFAVMLEDHGQRGHQKRGKR